MPDTSVVERPTLTRKQLLLLEFARNNADELPTEGYARDALYPRVLRPRVSLNRLEGLGLIRFVWWTGDECGYQFEITDKGRMLLARLGAARV